LNCLRTIIGFSIFQDKKAYSLFRGKGIFKFPLSRIGLAFTNADKSYALKFAKKKQKQIMPYWQYLILQFQIGIVFFYSGLSKCSPDWFNGNIIKGITDSAFLNNFLIYGGTVFDLLIPFGLFFRKTRFIAIILVIIAADCLHATLLPRFAENVRKKLEKQDGINPNLGIALDYSVAFNQRPEKIAINPKLDISRAKFRKYATNPWIIPLKN